MQVFETRYLRINQRVPVIHWELPDSIQFGTYLTTTELCASLHEVDNSHFALHVLKNGTFTFKPTFGDTPNASESTVLTVTFTPPYGDKNNTVAGNYAVSTKEVIIAVMRCRPDVRWKPR